MTLCDSLKRRWYVIIAILGIIIIIFLLNFFGCIPLAGAQNNHLNIHVENKRVITFIAYDETSKANLSSFNIQKPEELWIPSSVNKFDVVTFNHSLLNAHLKSGKDITVSIGGKDYQAELSQMEFDNIRSRIQNDDGIYSYHGILLGVNSDFLFTVGKNTIHGRITLNTPNGETFWIIPVEPRARTEISTSPLHIIYSSRNVKNEQFKID
ncbi:MAG: hypothetical protein M0Q91_03960 [Methanoregula sp.]|jgi:hypothetical protein|nr:hypothetical protein [Methanoregula sp.]